MSGEADIVRSNDTIFYSPFANAGRQVDKQARSRQSGTHVRARFDLHALTERPQLDSLPRIAVHDENVFRFDVTVDEAARVEVGEAACDPMDDGRGRGRVKVRTGDGELERAAAGGGVLKLVEEVEVIRRVDRGRCEVRLAGGWVAWVGPSPASIKL